MKMRRKKLYLAGLSLVICTAAAAQNQKASSKDLAAEVDKLNWEGIDLSNDSRYLDAADRFQKAISLDDSRSAVDSRQSTTAILDAAGDDLEGEGRA